MRREHPSERCQQSRLVPRAQGQFGKTCLAPMADRGDELHPLCARQHQGVEVRRAWIRPAEVSGRHRVAQRLRSPLSKGSRPMRHEGPFDAARVGAILIRARQEYAPRFFIELAQETGLPVIPHLRSNRADVRVSQQIQTGQLLRIAHHRCEVRDQFRIRQVSALGRSTHRQVLENQELRKLTLSR